jgi:hypothetical protein
MALVDAIAGMTFFTTPCVSDQVTPSIKEVLPVRGACYLIIATYLKRN